MPYQMPYLPQQPFMPYQPQGYMTAGNSPMLVQQQAQQSQAIHGFVYVTGLEGARAYQMPPNSEMPLFDSGGDIMYIKTTDGAGFPTIKVCDVLGRTDASASPQSSYVTRDELDRTYRDLATQIEAMKGAMNGTVPAAAAAAEPDLGALAGNPSDDGRRSARHASAGNAQ